MCTASTWAAPNPPAPNRSLARNAQARASSVVTTASFEASRMRTRVTASTSPRTAAKKARSHPGARGVLCGAITGTRRAATRATSAIPINAATGTTGEVTSGAVHSHPNSNAAVTSAPTIHAQAPKASRAVAGPIPSARKSAPPTSSGTPSSDKNPTAPRTIDPPWQPKTPTSIRSRTPSGSFPARSAAATPAARRDRGFQGLQRVRRAGRPDLVRHFWPENFRTVCDTVSVGRSRGLRLPPGRSGRPLGRAGRSRSAGASGPGRADS